MRIDEFLLARIAEDEADAQDASDDGHRWLVEEETIGLWPDDRDPADGFMHFPRKAHAYHAARWHPGRVLAECEAKRAVMAEHALVPETYGWYMGKMADYGCGICDERDGLIYGAGPCPTVQTLAAVYADHPDYRPEWAG